jgi:DNA polymerase-3 subunit epsilon
LNSWTEMPAAAFDLETTGIDVFSDRVVTGCIPRIDGADVRCNRWIADPGIPIPAEATAVHGITTEYAQKYGRPHADVVSEIVDELYACWNEGRYVATFNGCFDVSLIHTYRPDFEVRGLIVDASVLDKKYDKYRKGSRKLSAVCINYGMRLDDAHDAEADAVAAARLAWKLPRVYPQLADHTAAELMDLQQVWYREQAESFIDYLQRQGKPFGDVRTEWPIQTRTEEQAA